MNQIDLIEKNTPPFGEVFFLAPPVGLEPTALSVRNIFVQLPLERSLNSLFLPAPRLPLSAAGSGKRQAS